MSSSLAVTIVGDGWTSTGVGRDAAAKHKIFGAQNSPLVPGYLSIPRKSVGIHINGLAVVHLR